MALGCRTTVVWLMQISGQVQESFKLSLVAQVAGKRSTQGVFSAVIPCHLLQPTVNISMSPEVVHSYYAVRRRTQQASVKNEGHYWRMLQRNGCRRLAFDDKHEDSGPESRTQNNPHGCASRGRHGLCYRRVFIVRKFSQKAAIRIGWAVRALHLDGIRGLGRRGGAHTVSIR